MLHLHQHLVESLGDHHQLRNENWLDKTTLILSMIRFPTPQALLLCRLQQKTQTTHLKPFGLELSMGQYLVSYPLYFLLKITFLYYHTPQKMGITLEKVRNYEKCP